MRFATSLLGLTAWSLLALSSVAEEANSELVGCAAEPSEDFLALADEIRQQEIDNAFDESEAQQAFRIEVYFHVLTTTQQEMNSISVRAQIFSKIFLKKFLSPKIFQEKVSL